MIWAATSKFAAECWRRGDQGFSTWLNPANAVQAEKVARLMALAIIIMGVSGCGKTSVGLGLSEVLGWPFYDGDDFHPQANIDKMARGIALDDDDRLPWLERLHALIREHLEANRSLLVACSALKASYRDVLNISVGSFKNIGRVIFCSYPWVSLLVCI